MTKIDGYYFGVIGKAGHCLFYSLDEVRRRPLGWPQALTGGAIWYSPLDQQFAPTDTREQGLVKITHVEGWTVAAWWDQTGDDRPGSNSAYVTWGTHDFATMMEAFSYQYGPIARRLRAGGVELVEWRT